PVHRPRPSGQHGSSTGFGATNDRRRSKSVMSARPLFTGGAIGSAEPSRDSLSPPPHPESFFTRGTVLCVVCRPFLSEKSDPEPTAAHPADTGIGRAGTNGSLQNCLQTK